MRVLLSRTALHALHGIAWGALRVASPVRAKAAVDAVARLAPTFDDAAEAAAAARTLRLGTCLSRSLTIAACLPGAEVVIGVDPKTAPLAHAWVELDGVPLASEAPRGDVITRLPPSRARRDPGADRPPR